MIGQTVGQYKILDRLGAGGMGVVFKAQDLRLERFVALKFLPPGLSEEPRAKARFVQEARAASGLDHPNICTIHGVDETPAGQMFIVMGYYEGETLFKRLHAGQMTYAEALEIARQIAIGLDKAHKMGVIHRDIKPANIMLTSDGLVKILDFGLARVGSGTGLTRPGGALGTISFMAPEQASGKPTDHRADIWAWGVVLYQMLSGGKLPFHGDSDLAMLRAIVDSPYTPLEGVDADLTQPIEGILSRALAKDPATRYDSAALAASDIDALMQSLSGIISRPVFRTAASSASRSQASGQRSTPALAVIPFSNLTGNAEDEYFSDGLSEDLIIALSKLEGIHVTSRISSFAFKGKQATLKEIGDRLGVKLILEGSVRRAGSKMRISVQLVNVAEDRPLWTQRFDRDAADIFAIQDEIVSSTVSMLRVRLSTGVDLPLVKRYTDNLNAYNLYLQGRHFYNRSEPHALGKAIELFEKAIQADPSYALPYVGLSDSWFSLGGFGLLEPRVAWEKARENAQKALDLDSELADALSGLASVMAVCDHKWEEAGRNFRRAIELDPNAAHVRYRYSVCYLEPTGRSEEALAEYLRAQQLDPLSPLLVSMAAWNYYLRREFQMAIDECHRCLELDPAHIPALWTLGASLRESGRVDEALAVLERARQAAPQAPMTAAITGIAYARLGNRDAAKAQIAFLDAFRQHAYCPSVYYAWVYASLGEADSAFSALETAYEKRDFHLMSVFLGPRLGKVVEDARWNALRIRMGLAPIASTDATQTVILATEA